MKPIDRGDIKLAYDRAIAHDVADVAELLVTLAERITTLEKQLWCEQNISFRNQLDAVQVELEESQAREAKLRDLLEEATSYTSCPSWSPSITEEIKEALAVKPDDTALREMTQKAGEVMRQRCTGVAWNIEPDANGPIEAGIRALPGVTLEDLEK